MIINCTRTACREPLEEYEAYYNRSTQKLYCVKCAHWLNNDRFNKQSALELFGGPLCIPVEQHQQEVQA